MCETSQDVEEGSQKTGISLKRRMGEQHEGTASNSRVKKTQCQKENDRTIGSGWYKFNTVHLLAQIRNLALPNTGKLYHQEDPESFLSIKESTN